MRKNLYYTSSDNVTTIHAIEWIPETEIKAVLQISHGMVEYIGRYDRFANYLNEYGIYVVGNDHLGHGESVTSDDKHGFFKHPDGNECVIKDLHKLRKRTEKKYPDVPYFMLGHSMGSFLIREYMMVYGQGLAGVIVMGTGSQPNSVLVLGKIICKIMASFKGWEYRSKLIDRMVFSGNNKKFEPARTPQDWLTKDEKIVNAYRENPWCTFTFTLNGFYQLFRTIQFVQKKENIQKISKELPIFLVAGCEDPVGSFGKGVKKVYKSYVDAGIKDVKIKLYENDRHEILNETDYMVVYEDLRKWMEK
ncbi:MAG: alpha/beta fold hydrolase [Bariatricus sp.]|nr:alpha/beta fold hydrolase [Bariatricus sp.]